MRTARSGSSGPSPTGACIKQAVERAAVRRITFDELRHTFGTRMAAAGVPMRTIQHWMGHADGKTTQIYAHYQPSGLEADLVDQAFGM